MEKKALLPTYGKKGGGEAFPNIQILPNDAKWSRRRNVRKRKTLFLAFFKPRPKLTKKLEEREKGGEKEAQ